MCRRYFASTVKSVNSFKEIEEKGGRIKSEWKVQARQSARVEGVLPRIGGRQSAFREILGQVTSFRNKERESEKE